MDTRQGLGEWPALYRIQAWYPNVIEPPLTQYAAHYANALQEAIRLAFTKTYMTISVQTPDCLEVIKLWGQLEGLP